MSPSSGLLWSYEAELLIEAYNFHKKKEVQQAYMRFAGLSFWALSKSRPRFSPRFILVEEEGYAPQKSYPFASFSFYPRFDMMVATVGVGSLIG